MTMLDFLIEFVKIASFVTLSIVLFSLIAAIVKSVISDVDKEFEKKEAKKFERRFNKVDVSVGIAFGKRKANYVKEYSDMIKQHVRDGNLDEDLLNYYASIIESNAESLQKELNELERLNKET